MGSVFKGLARFFNPLALPIAGSGRIGVWGVVHHRGRKSGRMFATPVALSAKGDVIYVPLPYGQGTDWCRNLIAAGGGAISYGGHEYAVSAPRVVGLAIARPAFPMVLRPILGLVAKRYLQVRRGNVAQHAA